MADSSGAFANISNEFMMDPFFKSKEEHIEKRTLSDFFFAKPSIKESPYQMEIDEESITKD